MNSPLRTPAFLFSCAACALAGWLAGRGLAGTRTQNTPAFTTAPSAAAQPDEAAERDTKRTDMPLSPDELRAAMEQVLALRDDTARARALLAASRTFRPEDFAAALALFTELGAKKDWKLIQLCDALACEWVARDLTSARAWLKIQPPGFYWAKEARNAWLRADPRGYVSWLRSLDKAHFPAMSHDALCEVDPETAIELSSLRGGPKIDLAFGGLAKRNPQAAAERALNLPPNADRANAVSAVAKSWAGSDREAALAWARQLDDAALATQALTGIAGKLIEIDPPAAAQFVIDYPQLPGTGYLEGTMMRWVARDEDAALTWARGVEDPVLRGAALSAVLRSMAGRNARVAAETWAAENATVGGKLGNLDYVAAALASAAGTDEALRLIDAAPASDRAKAEDAVRKTVAGNRGWDGVAEIARAMPAGARRTEWLAETAKFFAADGDLPRAQRFAATLVGPEKNAALQAIGGVVLAEDFDAGARLIAGTGDRAALLTAIRGRFADDGGRVRSWITRTPLLTPEEKAQLRAPGPNPSAPR